jgi:hypothetical protein
VRQEWLKYGSNALVARDVAYVSWPPCDLFPSGPATKDLCKFFHLSRAYFVSLSFNRRSFDHLNIW